VPDALTSADREFTFRSDFACHARDFRGERLSWSPCVDRILQLQDFAARIHRNSCGKMRAPPPSSRSNVTDLMVKLLAMEFTDSVILPGAAPGTRAGPHFPRPLARHTVTSSERVQRPTKVFDGPRPENSPLSGRPHVQCHVLDRSPFARMASNLTNQVRNIAGVTTAVCARDLSTRITWMRAANPGAEEYDQHHVDSQLVASEVSAWHANRNGR